MDEEIIQNEKSEAEFFLGTVTAWDTAKGVQIQLDGQDSPMTKYYKQMLMCRPLKLGARVVVMKHSGTYVVLGEISNPTIWKKIDNLASNATLATVITKVNSILDWMRTQGTLWT